MALKLDILANTRQLVSEMRKGGASVEDISDALDDLARDAKISGDKTERAIDDIGDAGTDAARDVDKAADKMERSFRDLVRDAKKADQAVDKIGDSGKKGFDIAGDAAGEFKSEALSNFSEVTSSFDGSMESIGDLAQGTLGGIAGSIPGVGIAAGIAAAGVGLITAELQRTAEKSEETKQSIIDDFLEVGDALDKEAVDARVRDILNAEDTRKEAELLAELMGTTVGQAALALAGDFESAGITAEEAWEAINLAPGDVDLRTWGDLQTTLKATEDGMRYGREAAEAQKEANRRTAQSSRNAARETEKQTEKLREFFEQAKKPTTAVRVPVYADLSPFNRDVRYAMNQQRSINITAQLTRGRLLF